MDVVFNSPITYTGGKNRCADWISEFIPKHIKQLVSPFAGGLSLELNLAYHRGMQVQAYDVDGGLVNFWQWFLADPFAVYQTARDLLKENSREKLHEKKMQRLSYSRGLTRASWYYLYNRLSWNGRLSSWVADWYQDERGVFLYKGTTNGFSGKPSREILFKGFHKRPRGSTAHYMHPRCYPKLDITVSKADFKVSLQNANRDALIYADPPYKATEGLYNRGFDHRALYRLLLSFPYWLLSYGDNDWIRELYYDFAMQEREYLSGYRDAKTGKLKVQKDLLIMSDAVWTDSQKQTRAEPVQLTLQESHKPVTLDVDFKKARQREIGFRFQKQNER